MAAKKGPQDLFCMFCSQTPCDCSGLAKKAAAVKSAPKESKTVTVPVLKDKPEVVTLEQSSIEKAKRSGLSVISNTVKVSRKNEDDAERDALTSLVKAGFMVEKIEDPTTYASTSDQFVDLSDDMRRKLNMTPVEIDLAVWKARRRMWQKKIL